MIDAKAFGQEIVGMVRAHVEKSVAPVLLRLDALEKRVEGMPAPKDGRDGKSVTLDDVTPIILARIAEAEKTFPAIVEKTVADQVAALPVVKNGRDGKDADADEIRAMIEEAVAALPKPKDGEPGAPGRDAEPVDIDGLVARAVALIPVPKDGRDGIGMAGMVIDRSGGLIATMTDGTPRELGPVVGKDGLDGTPGVPGKDGRDGYGFEEMSEELADDGRTIIRRYSRGEEVRQFRHTMPVTIYRGVYAEGKSYGRGDTVTWAGSTWHCNEPTKEKPGDGTQVWTLSVKRGRDGKDGILKAEKPKLTVKV